MPVDLVTLLGFLTVAGRGRFVVSRRKSGLLLNFLFFNSGRYKKISFWPHPSGGWKSQVRVAVGGFLPCLL